MDSDNFNTILTFRILNGCFKIYINSLKAQEFREWRSENNWPRFCHICDRYIRGKEITLDHLIPVYVSLVIGKPELYLDKRNFAIAHSLCNTRRGNSLMCLPVSVRERLLQEVNNNRSSIFYDDEVSKGLHKLTLGAIV